MPDHITTILGLEIPSTDPLFLTALGFHIAAGLVCAAAGAAAMLSDKRPGGHPRFGTIYYWSLSIVFITTTVLSVMRWRETTTYSLWGCLPSAPRRWDALHAVSVGMVGFGCTLQAWEPPMCFC